VFNKILVPLDGSDLASRVLSKAEDLAKSFKSQLVLLAVGSAPVGEISESSPKVGTEAVARLPVVKYLEETAAALRAKNLTVTWDYKEGNPALEIMAYAVGHRMDLIILGSHGAGEVAWHLGSVAHRVFNHSPVPVLLLRVLGPQPPEHKSDLDYFSM